MLFGRRTTLPLIGVLFIQLTLAGCAAVKPLDPDPKTGQFESLSAISNAEIKVSKPLAGVRDFPFVYVRTFSSFRPAQFDAIVRESMRKIGFPKTVNEEDLTKLVIAGGLSGDIQNLTSVLALHRLSVVTGPFLVAEFRVVRLTDVLFRFDATIVDPVSGETVFAVSRQKINWLDFDREFVYPTMNAVKGWFDESSRLPLEKKPAERPNAAT